jgi:XisI protein
MDSTLDFYKQCVKKLLSEYEFIQDEDSKIELIFDDERMHYMALWVGWHGYKRVHQCAVHIDIVGDRAAVGESDRIVIQCNDTEDSVVAKLVEMGISQESIYLNFIHPKNREYLEDEAGVVAAKTT